MGTTPGTMTVARLAAQYLKKRYDKPGNVFVGVVSRLDSLVSGVLVLARTSKAASRLSKQIREHQVSKCYLALQEGCLERPGESHEWRELVDYVSKDEAAHRMRAVSASAPGAQLARLRVRQIASANVISLVEIELLTGRKHQIRLQLAQSGHPVLGDTKYGSRRKFAPGIALHCQRLKIMHPTKNQPLTFTASAIHHWPSCPKPLIPALQQIDAQE
jgi:23S rRNA pseudouridine1911/1915/1917 synthase